MNENIKQLKNGDFMVDYKVPHDGAVIEKKLGVHPSTQEFLDLLDKMREVALAKSHDYAGDKDPMSNFRMSELMGIAPWKAIVVRLGDKYSRIMNFCKKESLQVKDESIIDTLLDMANYSLLCIIMYNQEKNKSE